MPSTSTQSSVPPTPQLRSVHAPHTDCPLLKTPPLHDPGCSHRDFPLILLQPQGEVGHLDGDRLGHADFPIAPGHILLQDGKLGQARPSPTGLSQHVHTGAHEVEALAVEGGVMGISRCLAGGRAHSHTAQDTIGRLAGLVRATAGRHTGHQPALLTVAKGITLGSRVEGLFRRVVGALVHAAAGGHRHAGLTVEHEALVTHAALFAFEAAAPRHREVSTGQRAAVGTLLVVTVRWAAQRCGERGHQDKAAVLPGDTKDPPPNTHTCTPICTHTLTRISSPAARSPSVQWGPGNITSQLI